MVKGRVPDLTHNILVSKSPKYPGELIANVARPAGLPEGVPGYGPRDYRLFDPPKSYPQNPMSGMAGLAGEVMYIVVLRK